MAALVALTAVGCQKDPGRGGRAMIRGKVMVEARLVLTNPNSFLYEAPAMDQEVYIKYGDNIGPDDRIRTNFDGEYEFPYMRPGNYTIWTYSRDTLSTSGNSTPRDMAVIRQITVSDKKEVVEVPTMRIYVRP
jgi:hypothetical protein